MVAAWRDVGGFKIRLTFAEPDTEEAEADRTSVLTSDRNQALELVDQWLRRTHRSVTEPGR